MTPSPLSIGTIATADETSFAPPSFTQDEGLKLVRRRPCSTVDSIEIINETDHNSRSTRTYKHSLLKNLVCITSACIFGILVRFQNGTQDAQDFFACYLVEQSLSVDNLFVFLLLFDYYKIPAEYQERVLNWGLIGVVVMRALVIYVGAAMLHKFSVIGLLFAGVLVYSSLKVLFNFCFGDDQEEDLEDNAIVKFSRKLFPTSKELDEDRFFTIEDGVKKATPLLLCLVSVEISDVVFAVDSIPAVFGITNKPFIIFSSNLFAILNLRSLFIILSKAVNEVKCLEPAVGIILMFIGIKIIAEFFGMEILTSTTLLVVTGLLSLGVLLSIMENKCGNNARRQAKHEQKTRAL